MKRIIDIDKDYYEIIKHEVEHGHEFKPYILIANGIPLDNIKTEIEDVAFDWQEIDGEHESFMVVDLNDALKIIDKYRK